MLKYNTFRADRYLRSRFVEGRYFLANEATDIELELLDYSRNFIESIIGTVAVEDAWKVTRKTDTELLIAPGEAWVNGLPFAFRSGTDHLVSAGVLPAGVTFSQSSDGVTLNFTGAASSLYRIVIRASEESITHSIDPFLKHVNVPEATGQKVRLIFKIDVVPDSAQSSSPIPYTDEDTDKNLTNEIIVTPSGSSGTLVGGSILSGSEAIDGRNIELTINNATAGTDNPIPYISAEAAFFANGTLIDSVGQAYHINELFQDPTNANRVILRLDKEAPSAAQPDPIINSGQPYRLIKRDVYATSDTGVFLGRYYYHVAKASWNGSAFLHSSSITDLRERVITKEEFEDVINQKVNIKVTGGGIIDVDTDGYTLNWNTAFSLINPSGPTQTIAAGSAVLVDGGTLAYSMNLATGGAIAVGNLAVTVSGNVGPITSFSGGPSLATVRVGNIIEVGAQVAAITAIDDVAKSVTVSPAITVTGAATIYRDSFAPSTVALKENVFVLAVRDGAKIIVSDNLELSAGESNTVYDIRIEYPTGLAAGTDVTLPNNPNTAKSQYYSSTKRNLEVYVNQQLKYQGEDWIPVSVNSIEFPYSLPNNSVVHFRIDSLQVGALGGSGGGGSSTLQDAYDLGNTIVTSGGLGVVISGTASKVASFYGDIYVDGVIDPQGIEFTPQASNPLGAGLRGLWTNNSNQLVFENGTSSENISQQIEDLETGVTNPIQGSFSILKTGNVLSTLSAPAHKLEAIAGQAYSVNTSYLVRWGIDGEVVDQVYKATAANANDKKYQAIGFLLSTFAVSIGDTIKITSTGTHTLGSADPLFLASDIGKFVYLKNDGSGGWTTTPPPDINDAQYRVGVVQATNKIWVDYRQLDAIVPVPLYDERTLYGAGLAASTSITLPVNSRNGGAPQTYVFAEGRLKVYVNRTLQTQGFDWIAGTSPTSQIQFTYDLAPDSEVHYRIEPIGSGVLTSSVSISGDLQDAYNAGDTITVTTGNPITINGPVSEKLLVVNGDITVTGVIDPTAIEFTPQASNPLAPAQKGIWFSNTNEMIVEYGGSSQNVTTILDDVVSGSGVSLLIREFTNNTGSTIPVNTPVYSPTPGEIAPADGTDTEKFRVVGITKEAILNATAGDVAMVGTMTGVSGYTHNRYLYLGLTAGSVTTTQPTLGPYPAGFQVIKLGIIDGTNLHMQIQHVGTL